VRWGRLRLVLRSVAGQARSCVVLQRLRRVAGRPRCILSEFGCVRLAWAFDSDVDMYPSLEVVNAERILREEDVQTDWYDRAARLGLRAMPSDRCTSATEWRAARFFTNPFFPWTSRSMRPGFRGYRLTYWRGVPTRLEGWCAFAEVVSFASFLVVGGRVTFA